MAQVIEVPGYLRRRRVAPLVAFGLVVSALLSAFQDPVFRAGTPTVSIYATVVDRTGRLIPNLTRDDFEVFDNGIRQDLSVFANDRQPITLVMMLDRSESMERHFTLVRDGAERFVENLLPNDRVRIGSFSDRIQLDPETFTSDKDQLVRILHHNLLKAGITPLWNATSLAMTALAHEEGRRVVLLFTDGLDSPDTVSRNTTFREVRARSAAEGIMVYAIGLSNVCGPTPVEDEFQPASIREQRGGRGAPRRPGPGRGLPIPRGFPGGRVPGRGGGLGPLGPLGPPGGDAVGGRKPAERSGPCVGARPDPDLKALADDGGGGYFELRGTDDLGATFARVADELHHQYVLAFNAASLDGKTHQLDVRVRQPDLTVRARKSYVAAPVK